MFELTMTRLMDDRIDINKCTPYKPEIMLMRWCWSRTCRRGIGGGLCYKSNGPVTNSVMHWYCPECGRIYVWHSFYGLKQRIINWLTYQFLIRFGKG